MDFKPLSDRQQMDISEIILSEPIGSISYSEKAKDHTDNQDSALNLEFSIVLENGTKLQLGISGVFDTAGGMVTPGLSPKYYGSNIAAEFIRKNINRYLNIILNSTDAPNFVERLKAGLQQLLADIHNKIIAENGIECCGCISATISSEDSKYAIVANCGDTRSYFFMPGTKVSPQVTTLDHSNWLYAESAKIFKAFGERYPDAFAKLDQKKLYSKIVDNLIRFQVRAYSNSMIDEATGKPKETYTIFINKDLSEGPGKHKDHVFRYDIKNTKYLAKSNIVNNTLGSRFGKHESTTFSSNLQGKYIILSCSDGVYEILPIERIQQIIEMEYRESDPLSLSRIGQILRNELRRQIQKNAQNKTGTFGKIDDDFSFTIQEI